MGGQSVVLLAVGIFTSLVVAVAGVHQYLLQQHPPSEASGLLWRVENALSTAQDLEIDVSSTDRGAADVTARMTVRVLVSPIPILSVEYAEPAELAGQIVLVQNDLLSHYLPSDNLVIVKRWTGIPLAAVGLAGLDVSRLRDALAQSTVTARVLEDGTSLSTLARGADISFTPDATALGASPLGGDASTAPEPPSLAFAPTLAPDSAALEQRGTYTIEVRDAATGNLTEVVWVDRGTYFIRKILYYTDDQVERTIEVERLVINQGLGPEDLLTLPRTASTVRG